MRCLLSAHRSNGVRGGHSVPDDRQASAVSADSSVATNREASVSRARALNPEMSGQGSNRTTTKRGTTRTGARIHSDRGVDRGSGATLVGKQCAAGDLRGRSSPTVNARTIRDEHDSLVDTINQELKQMGLGHLFLLVTPRIFLS